MAQVVDDSIASPPQTPKGQLNFQRLEDIVEVFENEHYVPEAGFTKKELPVGVHAWSNRIGHNRVEWYSKSILGDGNEAANLPSVPKIKQIKWQRRSLRSKQYEGNDKEIESPRRKRSHSFPNYESSIPKGWKWADKWQVKNVAFMVPADSESSSATDGWIYGSAFSEFSQALAHGTAITPSHEKMVVRTRRWVRKRYLDHPKATEDENERVLCEGYLSKMARLGKNLGRKHWSIKYYVLSTTNYDGCNKVYMRAYKSRMDMELLRQFTLGRRTRVKFASSSSSSPRATPKDTTTARNDAPPRFSVITNPMTSMRKYTFLADCNADQQSWVCAIENARDLISAQPGKSPRRFSSSHTNSSLESPTGAPARFAAVDPPTMAWDAKVPAPRIDPDCLVGSMTCCLTTSFACSAKEFYEHFVSDSAIFSMKTQHMRRKQDSNVQCTSWVPSPRDYIPGTGDYDEELLDDMFELIATTDKNYYIVPGLGTESFRAAAPSEDADTPMPSPPTRLIAMKTKTPVGTSTKVSKLQWYYWFPGSAEGGGDVLVLHTSSTSWDVPYGNYFTVEDRFVVQDRESEDNVCDLNVYLEIKFTKSTMLKGMITKKSKKACISAYRQWNQMAHEALEDSSRGAVKGVNHDPVKSAREESCISEKDPAAEKKGGRANVPFPLLYVLLSLNAALLLLVAYGVRILVDIRRLCG